MTLDINPAIDKGQCLRTGVWYGDSLLDLDFPRNWNVANHWPETPPPLTDAEIAPILERPIGQPPIRELCRGAKSPLIVVDDVNRPTPVASVLPLVLGQFRDAGIEAQNVTILLSTGMHAAPQFDSVLSKVGSEAGSKCKIIVHNSRQLVSRVGKTSFGTPVYVNREVTKSDFVMGIGGIYPNHTAGYGGGSKLALGVLGFRSILALHYFHRSLGRSSSAERNTFRDDLDQIALMLKFRTMISIHSNASRQPVRITCGDYLNYFKDEVAFARRTFTVPAPANADLVISNAYPCDLSLTFAFIKGAAPLQLCSPKASRVLIASCPEGVGGHSLFPNINVPRFHNLRNYCRFGLIRPISFGKKASSALLHRAPRSIRPAKQNPRPTWKHSIWLYVPTSSLSSLPGCLPGVNVTSSWADVLQGVEAEQGTTRELDVALYPCVPLLSIAHPGR